MNGWLYALACVLVPSAIGLAMYALFEAWDQRRRSNRDDDLPHIDYHI